MKPITLRLNDGWTRTATGIYTTKPVGIGTDPVAGLSLVTALPNKAPAWTTRTQMAGNAVLTAASSTYQFFDPNGSNRDVTLPPPTTGMAFVIKHYGVANSVVVKDAAAATVVTLAATEAATVIYDGTAWQVL